MQGHRATVSSLSDFFDTEHESPSVNAALDQQSYWGNIQDQREARAPDSLPATPFLNPFAQNFLDDQPYCQSNNQFSSNNVVAQLGQSSSSRSTPVNLNLNPGFVGQGSVCSPLVESSEVFKSNMSEFQWLQPSSSNCAPFTVSSSLGSAHSDEASASRPSSSVEGRVLPCKRKIFHVEGYMNQSSVAGSSRNAQNAESSSWPQANLCIQEQVEPRLVLGVSGNSERVGPNGFNTPVPYSNSGNVAHSSLPNSGISPINNTNSLVNGGVSAPLLPALSIHAPTPFPPSGSSIRWNGDLMIRPRSSASIVASQEEGISSNRNILEHPMFVSANEPTNFVQSPAADQSVAGGTVRTSGNIGSSSRIGSHHASSSSSQNAHRLQSHRRYSEMRRRSLNADNSNAIAAFRSSNNLALSSADTSRESATLLSRSGTSSHVRHPMPLRQGDNVLGHPPFVRNFAAPSEVRRRFLSEIRSVLDMVRHGETLRFEDLVILNQSLYLGAMTQGHDRHRDMRLDVDNMSYEELLALEERIGNVSTGASEETILTQLKQRKCVIAVGTQTETEPCCICQEEYNDGEDLGTLECGHDFHRDCIKQWLKHKNICPICKTTGVKPAIP